MVVDSFTFNSLLVIACEITGIIAVLIALAYEPA